MPIISLFYGVMIQMYWGDHAPPYFHALYAEHEALVDIQTLEVVRGSLPKRALALLMEWAKDHQNELMENWDRCSNNTPPLKITPLI